MTKHLLFPSAVLLTGTLGRMNRIEIRLSEPATRSTIRISNRQKSSSLPAMCASTGRPQSDKPICQTHISEATWNAKNGIYSALVLTSAAQKSGKDASVSARQASGGTYSLLHRIEPAPNVAIFLCINAGLTRAFSRS